MIVIEFRQQCRGRCSGRRLGRFRAPRAATWRLVMASLSTTGELLSLMCPIAMVMADAWCWWRTAAPPLRGFRIVGRVSMKRLPQFEVRRWCIYRLMATEVGSPLWWILMDGSGFANVG